MLHKSLSILFISLLVNSISYAQVKKKILTENEKIEQLILAIQNLKSAQFNRNGTLYDAETASKHLKMKWNKNQAIKNGVFNLNYHSFTLLASIFKKINSKIVNPHKPDPPYEKKGKGTPIVGKIPTTIAILTKKWMNKIPATQ